MRKTGIFWIGKYWFYVNKIWYQSLFIRKSSLSVFSGIFITLVLFNAECLVGISIPLAIFSDKKLHHYLSRKQPSLAFPAFGLFLQLRNEQKISGQAEKTGKDVSQMNNESCSFEREREKRAIDRNEYGKVGHENFLMLAIYEIWKLMDFSSRQDDAFDLK